MPAKAGIWGGWCDSSFPKLNQVVRKGLRRREPRGEGPGRLLYIRNILKWY